VRSAPFATRRARDVNHGDRTPLRGSESKTLCWISVDDAQAFTVYASARVQPASARVVPMITIEWGHGGASLFGEYPIVRRLRIPVVASMVKLAGRLVDTTTGKAPPSTVTAEISATIAPGADGQTLHTTAWTGQTGAEGLVASGPQRLFTVDGYNAAASLVWLMLFDDVVRPPNGTRPEMARPAPPSPRTFRLRTPDTRGFTRGVYWAASSTPLVLTFAASASLRVDTEVLT
jgi:hypothetical protein